MIGNLILTIGVALISASIVVVGDVKAKEVYNANDVVVPISQNISYVDSLGDFQVYTPSIPFNYTGSISRSDFGTSFNEGKAVYQKYNSESMDLYYDGSLQSLEEGWNQLNEWLVGVGSYVYESGVVTNRTAVCTFNLLSYNESITWNNEEYLIDGFEFTGYLGFTYDDNSFALVDLGTFQVNGEDLTKYEYYGVGASSFIGAHVNDYLYYDEYSISLSIRESIVPSNVIGVRFIIEGQWCCNYRTSYAYGQGYTSGYAQGNKDGYSKGYSDARDFYQQSSDFQDLFSAVADTPLRFLYGLFSFDLFGTSVLVIVLTLLTGIAVFGIIKKVWK